MKKFLSLILAICLVVAMVPMTASAETATSGTTGDCTWSLDGTVLTISGNGEMDDYFSGAIKPWGAEITKVIIGNGVTNIGRYMFADCGSLTSIKIPNSVKSIGEYAFYCCNSLTNIDVAEENENYASIDGVLFDKNLKTIIQYPANKSDSSYSIPNTVTSIVKFAFYNSENLTNITIPDSVTNIEKCAFKNTGYYNNESNWQNDVLYISNHLIECKTSKTGECKIKDGTKTIADLAFIYCSSLTSVTIPDSVTNIGEEAFECCGNLVSITISKNIESIAGNAFYATGYYNNAENWQNDALYIGNYLIEYNTSNTGEYTIKDGTKIIASGAFALCDNLTDIVIPDSVTNIGDEAFWYCSNLKSIKLPKELTVLDDAVFWGCDNLSTIYIPKSLTLIKESNFSKSSWGQSADLTVYYEGNEDDWAQVTVLDYNKRLTEATVKYNQIIAGKTGICNIAPKTEIDGFKTDDIAVFDKNDKEIKYNTEKGGWPLVKGEAYAVKLSDTADKGAYEGVKWNITLQADTIFSDTKADGWYNDAVTYAVGAGIMTGYKSNGLFGTSDSIQRQDFIVMLARYDGADLSDYAYLEESTFPDVEWNSYYEAAVEWGADKGIITGYTVGDKAGCFGVGDTITREQLVTMLYRYAKYKGKDVTVSGNAEETTMRKFNDYSNVSVFSKEAVLWATEKGVITGKGVNKDAIDPQGNAQRCEVAQIMYNIFKNNIL